MMIFECFESEARKVYSLVCSSRARMPRARVCGGICKKKKSSNFSVGKDKNASVKTC